MFSSLKQLFTDLQDKSAGEKISRWPLKTPLVLYTKFYAILVVVITLSVIYSIVYYLPQIPKFISNSMPDITVTLKDNILSFSPPDPIRLTSPEGSLILDTREKPEDYSSYPIGFFIYREHMEIKDRSEGTQKLTYDQIKPFSFSKPQLITWFTQNKIKLILITIPAILVLSAIISAFIWGLRVAGFYIAAFVFFLFFKLLNRPLVYSQILPIVIYASILPLLISYILFFAPHPLLSFLNFALFIFFTLSWLLPLTKKSVKRKVLKHKK